MKQLKILLGCWHIIMIYSSNHCWSGDQQQHLGIHQVIVMYSSFWIHFFASVFLLGLYMLFISRVEKKEFSRLFFIGRFYKLSPITTIAPMPENLKVWRNDVWEKKLYVVVGRLTNNCYFRLCLKGMLWR